MDIREELNILIRSRQPLISFVTGEEERGRELIEAVAQELNHREIYFWNAMTGFRKVGGGSGALEEGRMDPLTALQRIDSHRGDAIFVVEDFHPYFEEPVIVRMLRNLLYSLRASRKTIILLSPFFKLPPEVRDDVPQVFLPLPDYGALEALLQEICEARNVKADLSREAQEKLVKSALGLTENQARGVFVKSILKHQVLDQSAIPLVLSEKQKIIRKDEVLEFFPAREKISDIGGLDNLKEWLKKRDKAFSERAKEYGLPNPKGILIIGVQGTGKSLTAKATSALWRLPLLRMDMGKVFGSLVGESEERMRKALLLAETISPCILWIDEIEKAFSQAVSAGDSGTSARVFGTFLTWLQEKEKPVFVLATGNDIANLPPELMRKGRFDEIFFVDLPTYDERNEIFRVHLSKVRPVIRNYDVPLLAQQTQGFSGAEIEQAIVNAMYNAFDDGEREFTTEDIVLGVREVIPISKLMSERIEKLRDWAAERTRRANKDGSMAADEQLAVSN
ncbi:MAG: AAA family ATPase [Deltaproteobacteria bacterium]|nr:AAA family ATPase [Deltaproteobacteria bacterium]